MDALKLLGINGLNSIAELEKFGISFKADMAASCKKKLEEFIDIADNAVKIHAERRARIMEMIKCYKDSDPAFYECTLEHLNRETDFFFETSGLLIDQFFKDIKGFINDTIKKEV